MALLQLTGAGAAWAQTALGVKPLDQFFEAVERKSVAPLQPYLTDRTQVDQLPAAYTAQLLPQLLAAVGPVSGVRLIRQQQEGANTRYVCALTRKEQEKEYDFLLTPADTFLELNLGMAQAKKVDTRFRPEDLALPPRLTAPIRLIDGLIVVEAEIDGRRGAFFLDTGAATFVLNKARFAQPNTTASVASPDAPKGVNGSVGAMSYYKVGRFDWEGLGFQNKEVVTADLTQVEKKLNGIPLLGIIGYNLLNQYALTLDYRAGRVELRRPGTDDAAAAVPLLTVPFTLRGHLPVLPFTLEGQTYDLALDTGAQNNLLDEQLAPTLASRLRKRTQATLAGAGSATRQVTQGQLPEMKLAGKLSFRRQQTVFSDISHLNQKPGTAAIQGIAGYPMLSQYRTTIDYVNNQLILAEW